MLHALSDSELDNYYHGDKRYLGTYAKDVIPAKLTKKNGAFIINMNNSNQGGSHWIALILNKDNTVYFDSFGVVPSEEVLAFMKKRKKPMYYVDRQLQHLKSSSCGWFCVHFINECIIKGRHILDVLLLDFSHNVSENERLLQGYFRS